MAEGIQLRRVKGWRMPPNTKRVDRSTRWGNQFVVWCDTYAEPPEWLVSCGGNHWHVASKEEGHALAVKLHREWAQQHRVEIIKGLRGYNLACWCALGTPCHRDTYLELANAPLAGGASDE